ncbi:FRG domain-containing protein [Photobacterium phosphoreum]|uniref:FRG domain-containing protein n=1 Tax=Photobacterium phosphoreum TaxID=659 RepID=UPI00242F4613|nr:FRG domain-containing protein [Photobacterium phosphoreum]
MSSAVEKKYYLNLPLWPEFDIFDKTVDGLIPSARIESWEDYDRVVRFYCDNDHEDNYVFRGQKHYKWQLEPTLDRLVHCAVTENVAEKQLRNFKLSTRGRLQDKSVLNSDTELWALGQHHGLATPLLDWSQSPYVAMFFAFEGADDPTWVDDDTGELNNYSRTVFILNKSFIQDLIDDEGILQAGEQLQIVEPSIDDHGRLVNQAGLFSFAPYGEILESSLERHLAESGVDTDDVKEVAKYICRIHIPNEKDTRQACLKKLRKMNIHHASLFPDLIGASGYCNDLIRDSIVSSEKDRQNEEVSATLIDEKKQRSEKFESISQYLLDKAKVKGFLNDGLLTNEFVARSVTPQQINYVIDELFSFINEKAGVDWYKKESVLARLRNILRRAMRKQQFPEDHIDSSAQTLIQIAARESIIIEKEDWLQDEGDE